MARNQRPMSAGLKWVTFATFGALWGSGSLWLVLHEFFARPSDFGSIQHPWEPAVLRIHGWIAVVAVFLLGWVTARHVSDRWPRMTRRVSGVAMLSVAGILALSGYALYYTTDGLHDIAAAVHEILGAMAILPALGHWRRVRSRTAPRERAHRHHAA